MLCRNVIYLILLFIQRQAQDDSRLKLEDIMKTYWVYILECVDGKLYTGMTNDIDRRLMEHQSGSNPTCWTNIRRPVKLVFKTSTNDVHYAIALEKRIKKWKRHKKDALIRGQYDLLVELSQNRDV